MALREKLIRALTAFSKSSHYYVGVDRYISIKNGMILFRENTRPNLMMFSYPFYLVADDGEITGILQLPLKYRFKLSRIIPERYREKYLDQEADPYSPKYAWHKYWFSIGDNKHISEDWSIEESELINKKIFSEMRELKIEYFVTQAQGLRFISAYCNIMTAEQLKMNLGEDYYVSRMNTLAVEIVKRSSKIMHYHPIMGMAFMEKTRKKEG